MWDTGLGIRGLMSWTCALPDSSVPGTESTERLRTMADSTRSSYRQRSMSQASAGGGNAVDGLGLIGALVFFWQ
jgi:hypothetical protein